MSRGVRIVPFNQVGVVTVHRANEVCKRSEKRRRQAATEAGGLPGQVEREIGECFAVPGAVSDEQWLHQREDFAPIPPYYVRFHCRLHC